MWSAWVVFFGGGLGALARHAVGLWVPNWPGTLAVNLLGCFLLGLLVTSPLAGDRWWASFLGVGVFGGFTTYSTFNLQLLQAITEGRAMGAATILFTTLVGGLLAGALGMWSGGMIPR